MGWAHVCCDVEVARSGFSCLAHNFEVVAPRILLLRSTRDTLEQCPRLGIRRMLFHYSDQNRFTKDPNRLSVLTGLLM